MAVERSSFLVIAAALAAGGVAGWVLHERGVGVASEVAAAEAKVPVKPADPAPTVVVIDRRPAEPACDDGTGAAEDCPSVGPSDEGVCSNVIFKRCGDYKAAFKPKVAQEAVACLRRLKGAQMCDAARVNLCGHEALVAACQEPSPPDPQTTPASAVMGANGAAAPPVPPPPSAVTTACESIVKSCGSEPLKPTMNDCKQTLSGMNESGRASMLSCMATHCTDRGLLGCEAMKQ